MDGPAFDLPLVKAVFRDVTPLNVSRSAARAAASATRTVLTGLIDGALRAAAEGARKKLLPQDLVTAIDRDVELEVGVGWYQHSPTFKGLTGVVCDAEGVPVQAPGGSGSGKPSAVAGAHRFEAGIRKLLRERGAAAVQAMVRDLDGIASAFLTDLARDAAMVVREGGIKRFGTVALTTPGEPSDPRSSISESVTESVPETETVTESVPETVPETVPEFVRALSTRTGDGRTIGRNDVLAAVMIQLFGEVRQRALAAALEATGPGSDG
ncbi:hypothetical protein OG599_19845 [Streptomyces sp. NBC_01335]|nr:hypothetical protein OG599_19845 [Streptomyces sp. NBC_01335]